MVARPVQGIQIVRAHCSKRKNQIPSLVLSYFLVGCFITPYTKWVIKDYGFPFPLTLLMMSSSFMFTALMSVKLARRYCQGKTIKLLSPWQSLKLSLVGVLYGLELACSVASLLTLSVSFHTMIKATTPVFIYIFSLVLQLQKFRLTVAASLALLLAGVGVLSWGEEAEGGWAPSGVLLALAASVLGGLKWALTQVYLQGKFGLGPLDVMFYYTPATALSLLPAALVLESHEILARHWGPAAHLRNLGVVWAGVGAAAFLILSVEFRVVAATSSLTYSVLTMVKEVLVFFVGVWFLGDPFGLRAFIGFLLCMAGVAGYSFFKYLANQEAEREAAAQAEIYSTLQDLDQGGALDDSCLRDGGVAGGEEGTSNGRRPGSFFEDDFGEGVFV